MTLAPSVSPESSIPQAPVLAYVPPDVTKLFSERSAGLQILDKLKAIPVVEANEQVFANALTYVCETVKRLEEVRTAITGPLLDVKKKIDDLFKPARKPWEDCEALVRANLQQLAQARLDAARVAREQAFAAAAVGDTQGVSVALAQVPAKVSVDGASNGEEWELASWDSDMSKVDPSFLCLDKSAIKIFLAKHKNSQVLPEIRGLVFRRKATVRKK